MVCARLPQVCIQTEIGPGGRSWLPGLPPVAAVVAAGEERVQLQALTDPAVLPDDWEVICVRGAANHLGGSQWELPLHIGVNDAVFHLRRKGNAEEQMVDVTVRIIRGGVLRGFRLPDGEPYGALVRQPAVVGDADVRWTLELPAHGLGRQMLVPELEGGRQALPPGWALRVAILDVAGIRAEPEIQPFGELQLPAVALGPGGMCFAEVVVVEGNRTVGPTHVVTIRRADIPITPVLVRFLVFTPPIQPIAFTRRAAVVCFTLSVARQL